jgi:protein-S-isoprenylcysteine O-methyltransferase Ste14
MNLQKLLKIVAIVIGVISIFFLGSIISTGDEAIKAGEASGTIDVFMNVSYVILAIAVLIVLVFSVLNLVSNTAGLKNTLMGVGAFVVLALLCYFGFATGVETTLKDGDILSESGSKLVGAGLYLFYFLAVIAGGIMLGFGIKKMAK